MDDEMEDMIELEFLDQEVDLDYEFDAAHYFDFTQLESYSESQEAERWFESAGSYPSSPFIIKLNWNKDINVENSNTPKKSEDRENMKSNSDELDNYRSPEVSEFDGSNGGASSNHVAEETPKAKSLVKSFSRSSTLMKPTASHLAKQNQRREICSSRFLRRSQKLFTKTDEKSSQSPVTESQATKRQRLEIGYLRKVAQLKHQSLFLHKISKRVGQVDMNSVCIRPKVTIPREPYLETALRARRRRPNNIAELGERTKLNVRGFKARPLNRKILEAPSLPLQKKSTPQLPEFQEFHLKTSERAIQHTVDNVVNSPKFNSISENGTTDFKRQNSPNSLRQDKCETIHRFKALPLNKKIISSRGELGVFRNIKRDATIPIGFKFPTDERFSQTPPIELFNKLSLTEAQNNVASQPKPLLPNKGLKENAPISYDQEHGIINAVKDNIPQRFWGKQNQCGSNWMIPEYESRSNINRSLDIR